MIPLGVPDYEWERQMQETIATSSMKLHDEAVCR